MPVIDGGTSFKYGAYLSDKSDLSTIAAFGLRPNPYLVVRFAVFVQIVPTIRPLGGSIA